jgi:hypothetical protein
VTGMLAIDVVLCGRAAVVRVGDLKPIALLQQEGPQILSDTRLQDCWCPSIQSSFTACRDR